MNDKKIRILLADDHQLFREGLYRILQEEENFQVIGDVSDGQQAVMMADKHKPDVVILDIAMPIIDGLEATEKIKLTNPQIAILIVSAYNYESYIKASIQAGASGYLQKSSPVSELIKAINLVYSGKSIFDTEIIKRLITTTTNVKNSELSPLTPLNKRELDVIRSAAMGNSNKKIAVELGISDRTVQSHMVNIFRKLHASSRTEAVLLAMRAGWLLPNDLP